MNHKQLTPDQRLAVNALKSDGHVFITWPGRSSGKRFLAAVAVAEMATEMGGITVRDARTNTDYFVPPGTPWQEALPVRMPA